MKLLKGKKIADKILGDLKKKISADKNKPGLAVILVGNDKASQLYVKLKKKAAEKNIKKAVFDRGWRKYHGRVKAVAEGARKEGLQHCLK